MIRNMIKEQFSTSFQSENKDKSAAAENLIRTVIETAEAMKILEKRKNKCLINEEYDKVRSLSIEIEKKQNKIAIHVSPTNSKLSANENPLKIRRRSSPQPSFSHSTSKYVPRFRSMQQSNKFLFQRSDQAFQRN